ncbi:MAG: AzlC family ABC transporter permease [Myxococcales bacterium]
MSAPAALRAHLAHPEFRRGLRDMMALMPGMLAWGLVAGVAMVKGGLSVWLSLVMTFAVYSAGAQLGAIALMADAAPLWIIVVATFCVNLRFVIFSAGLRPYMMPLPRLRRWLLGYLTADLSYVVFMQRYGSESGPAPGQLHYLSGLCAANWIGWQAASVVGVLFADSFPAEWGLSYAGVIALLGLCCTLMRDWQSGFSASVAFATTLLTRSLPLRLNIVAAIAAAVASGMWADRFSEERRMRLKREAVR